MPHFWGFIETRPDMRARQHLAEAYRVSGRLEQAAKLMKRRAEDCATNVVFTWCRILEGYLARDPTGARAALVTARHQNTRLKGHRKPPKNLPSSCAEGSREEAVTFAGVLLLVW